MAPLLATKASIHRSTTNVNTPPSIQNGPFERDSAPDNAQDIYSSTQPGPGKERLNTDALPQAATRTKLQRAVIMAALSMSLFLSALDTTVITTVVPTIVSDFNAPAGYIWAGSAYLLGNASCVPVWGKLSDIFGRKQTLLIAVGIFLLGSLLCALSNSMGMFIAARAIQGVGGGGAIVLPNICVSDIFSMKERGMYLGLLSTTWALASAIGPVIGGAFTSRVSWRWCFWINLPFGGLAVMVLVFFLKLHNPRTPIKQGLAAIDWIGNLLLVGSTLMVLMGLQFGGNVFAWNSVTVICLIVFGAVGLGLFAVYESKFAAHPVIPTHIFGYRNSIAAYGLAIMHALAFLSGTYWLPLYFQAVLGANSLLSGVYLLPYVLSSSFLSVGVGIFIKKTGKFRLPAVVGQFIFALGLGLFTDLGNEAHWARIIVFQIIAGLGSGTNFASPLIALQTNVKPQDIGSATSAYSFARQIGTAVSVVLGGVVFSNVMNAQQADLVSTLGSQLASAFAGGDAFASVPLIATIPAADQQNLVRTAYWDAIQKMFILYACVAFVGFLISLFIKQATLSQEHSEHKTGLQSLKKENGPDNKRWARKKSEDEAV